MGPDPAPKVVASPDGAHLAVLLDGRLSLYSLDGGRRLGGEDVVGTDVVFCGPHLLVHASDPAGSLLTLLAVPSLSPVSVLELMVPTRIQAASSAYALLDQGDQALMAQCTNATIAVAPLRPPAAFARAVGLEASQFVTFSARGAEVWDAATRRPLARLGLALPNDTATLGLTNRGASLWIATSQPALHVARISDGRISTLRLDAQPRNVRSHPALAWVVADVGDRTLAINLAVKEIEVVGAGMAPIVAVTPLRDRPTGAMLVALDGERLHLRAIGSDADVDRPVVRAPSPSDDVAPLPPPLTPRAEPPPVSAEAVPQARPMTVSERLAQRSGRAELPKARMLTPMTAAPGIGTRLDTLVAHDPVPPPDPFPNPRPVPDPFPPEPSPSPDPSPFPFPDPSPGPSPDPSPFPSPEPIQAAAPAPRPAPPRPAPPVRRVATSSRPGVSPAWRNELLAWARGTTATAPAAAPLLEGSSLHALGRRLALTPAAAQILAALYAAWLDGRAETGTSMARLAELAAIAGDDAWSEALGTGRLDELGLVRRTLGRVRLTAAAGDFLDGRSPAVIELIGGGAPAALPDGVFRVEADRGESARACAQRLTRARGLELVSTLGTLALCEPDGGARAIRPVIEQGRLEAWLRGLAMATTFDVGAVVPRPAETLLWIVPAGAPERPGAPPRWRP